MAVDYSKIITDICKDILKLTDMFPYFIIAAVLITCFIYTIFRWHKKLKFVLWCLFIFYIEALLWITFFSREPGSRRAIDMTFLYTWGYTAQEHAFFIENIILFVPFGFMMPCIFRMFRKMPVCVMGGFIFSVMIEVVQYITQRGYSHLDDVGTNTAGALAGWIVWALIAGIIYMIKRVIRILMGNMCSVHSHRNFRRY